MKSLQKLAVPFKTLLIIFLMLTAVFIAYSEALNNNFLTMWDTERYVIHNEHIKAINWENIQWMFANFYMANWHPLTWLSHALDYAWFGLEPWGHHLVSLIIHAFNTVLLFALVIVLITFKTSADNASSFARVENKTLLAAGIAAFLFGIHPQHVESVVWIAERKDVLSLFFILLGLLSYIFYNAAVQATKARLFWYLSTLLCFILALLSKPMAVTFPVILLLMDVYPLNRTAITASKQQNCVSYKKLVIEKIPFFVLSSFAIVITLLAQSPALFGLETFGLEIRLLNSFHSVIFYISKFFIPINLSPFYPYPSSQTLSESYFYLIPIIGVLLITGECVYLWYKKKYYWLIAWLFYLVTLSPVIGIIQVGRQAAADRYVYLPTIPFYILLGIGFARLLYAKKIGQFLKLGVLLGFFIISIVLIQLTQKQTWVWKDDLIFWSYIEAYAPNSALVQHHLGSAYSNIGEYDKAAEHFNQAIFIVPNMSGWYPDLLNAYIKSNQLQKILNLIKTPLEHDIDIGLPLEQLHYIEGNIYFIQGRLLKAEQALIKALEINPDKHEARELLLKITSQKHSKSQLLK